ncbi:MAG TPA: hypothetical protein PLU04_00380 [Anaerolineaceae bacterium]|nr:hypothetical protein [Anaerolineaceae bacterium]HQF44946.1 hypothetical protein [Anaerolineaceae bacterium]HQJ02368.1 hypothetical protein [Anaerolineaceae bacterium]
MNKKILARVLGILLVLALLLPLAGSGVAQGAGPAPAGKTSPSAQIQAIPGQFYYLYVPGSALRPRNSSAGWDVDLNGGCIYTTNSAGDVFNVDIQLPEQARILYLRMYYYDSSATTSNAWVTAYDGEGGFDDLLYVASTGNAGYGTSLSALTPVMVDNFSRSMVLNWRPNETGNTMQLCGLRIAYRMPDYPIYLPAVLR